MQKCSDKVPCSTAASIPFRSPAAGGVARVEACGDACGRQQRDTRGHRRGGTPAADCGLAAMPPLSIAATEDSGDDLVSVASLPFPSPTPPVPPSEKLSAASVCIRGSC